MQIKKLAFKGNKNFGVGNRKKKNRFSRNYLPLKNDKKNYFLDLHRGVQGMFRNFEKENVREVTVRKKRRQF